MSKPQVIKLSQPGFDVKTAGDENLIYNSNWPLLKIAKQGTFKFGSGLVTDTIRHDLGYNPVYWFFTNNILNNVLTPGSAGALDKEISYISHYSLQPQFVPLVDKTSLSILPDPTFIGPAQIYYYIFALDLEVPYTAPSINIGHQPSGTPPKNVFKLAKPGKSTNSHHLEDYSIHSQCRSPLIHAVYPHLGDQDFGTGTGFIFYHNLGYVPMFFLYAKENDKWGLLSTVGLGSQADTQKITINLGDPLNTQYSLVVLKDPFAIDYAVTVNI